MQRERSPAWSAPALPWKMPGAGAGTFSSRAPAEGWWERKNEAVKPVAPRSATATAQTAQPLCRSTWQGVVKRIRSPSKLSRALSFKSHSTHCKTSPENRIGFAARRLTDTNRRRRFLFVDQSPTLSTIPGIFANGKDRKNLPPQTKFHWTNRGRVV